MFLAAALRAGGEQSPVKVRNMSPHGAMIDTALGPPPGTEVMLIRGSLMAQGTVVWSSEKRCGLHFSSALVVAEWLAAPQQGEQQRVDEVVAQVRAEAARAPVPAPTALPDPVVPAAAPVLSAPPRADAQLVDDFRALRRLLQDLEDDLASDDDTVARHGMKLQNLDIAMQMIRALEREFSAAEQGRPAAGAGLDDLRAACRQALGKG